MKQAGQPQELATTHDIWRWPPVEYLTLHTIACYTLPMITKKQKENIVKKFGRHEGDTGSAEVQVAFLTKRIKELADHLKKHKKDNHSRKGLLQLVADRQAHMRYLKRKSAQRYTEVAQKLGLK
jgi:small subunit ribosomal protein S15